MSNVMALLHHQARVGKLRQRLRAHREIPEEDRDADWNILNARLMLALSESEEALYGREVSVDLLG